MVMNTEDLDRLAEKLQTQPFRIDAEFLSWRWVLDTSFKFTVCMTITALIMWFLVGVVFGAIGFNLFR